jgi:hypothetical protein
MMRSIEDGGGRDPPELETEEDTFDRRWREKRLNGGRRG